MPLPAAFPNLMSAAFHPLSESSSSVCQVFRRQCKPSVLCNTAVDVVNRPLSPQKLRRRVRLWCLHHATCPCLSWEQLQHTHTQQPAQLTSCTLVGDPCTSPRPNRWGVKENGAAKVVGRVARSQKPCLGRAMWARQHLPPAVVHLRLQLVSGWQRELKCRMQISPAGLRLMHRGPHAHCARKSAKACASAAIKRHASSCTDLKSQSSDTLSGRASQWRRVGMRAALHTPADSCKLWCHTTCHSRGERLGCPRSHAAPKYHHGRRALDTISVAERNSEHGADQRICTITLEAAVMLHSGTALNCAACPLAPGLLPHQRQCRQQGGDPQLRRQTLRAPACLLACDDEQARLAGMLLPLLTALLLAGSAAAALLPGNATKELLQGSQRFITVPVALEGALLESSQTPTFAACAQACSTAPDCVWFTATCPAAEASVRGVRETGPLSSSRRRRKAAARAYSHRPSTTCVQACACELFASNCTLAPSVSTEVPPANVTVTSGEGMHPYGRWCLHSAAPAL